MDTAWGEERIISMISDRADVVHVSVIGVCLYPCSTRCGQPSVTIGL